MAEWAGMPRRRTGRKTKTDAFAPVREYGRTLPEVEEGTMYGTPALKVRGKMFACIASHSSAEPNTLVVRVPFDQRDELIATDPSTYYLTDHYVGYASVLVRLSRVHPDALRDLLLSAWRFMSRRGQTPTQT
ncbi:MAG TPA: MmcQ/YjbR family DNA-binding protein [Vicinamibacterales bacterium]